MNREEAEKHANELLSHYGKQSWDEHFSIDWSLVRDNDEMKRRLATFGTIADIWRIEAYFSHLEKPVGFATNTGKQETYEQIAQWLMSENIQRILVYKNDKLYQTITVNASTE